MNLELPEPSPAAQPTVQIQRVTSADAEAIAELAAEIWRTHYNDIISAAQIEYMLAQRYMPALIRDELARGVLWDKLHIAGRVVSYSSYFPVSEGREMKLDKLYVHPSQQRRGYGGLLIARALGAAIRAQP